MSANNPFNKSGKTPPNKKGADQARRVVENNSGNRAGIGQRKGKTAPKPGATVGGGSSSSGSGSTSRGTTPSLPKNRPSLPKGGTGGNTAAKRGCAGLTGGLLLLMFGAIFAIGKFR